MLYHYRALITRILDGDTFEGVLDLGANVKLDNQTFRPARIDAWEVRGEEKPLGLIATEFVRPYLPLGQYTYVHTYKDKNGGFKDSFGRWIVDVYPDGFGSFCLNDLLVQEGHAVYVDY